MEAEKRKPGNEVEKESVAGHMTAQKLGGKKICWAEGVTVFF